MTIARLRGLIDDVGLDGVLVDVGGVGYPVLVSTRTRAALPGQSEVATLLIETQIREQKTLELLISQAKITDGEAAPSLIVTPEQARQETAAAASSGKAKKTPSAKSPSEAKRS